jgi:signal transduction histidine kinase
MMRLFQERGEAITARDEFLAIAAHELRTPLTSLQLQLTSLARLVRETPTASEKLRVVARQGVRLNHLVEALLDVARLSTGRLQLGREELDLAELAQEVTARFADDLERAGCELQLRTRPMRGCWDRLRVEQVLTNLLANAIKFGPGRPIEVCVEGEGGLARLVVRDHGLGISPEAQRRIFERFERAVSFRSFGGLGLGLYVSKQIAEAHGGNIHVTSEPGHGATFTVELPVLPHQRLAASSEHPAPS